ncbi:SHOCT domain-containing protein [Natronorarus salvus]|uniref:SHOCT domain-containing protein n=1 Tax=Natronorarus salvus TaxID=3117733 RepID=UPI002F267B2F
MTGPRERLVENVTSATALIVVGLGILAFALSVPYFWLVFVVGLFVVVPLVGLLFGAEDWRKWDPLSDEFWEDLFGEEGETETDPDEQPTDSLQTLRDRYARGELTDEQFERKLALLLETESIEDVEDRMRAREPSAERLRERE